MFRIIFVRQGNLGCCCCYCCYCCCCCGGGGSGGFVAIVVFVDCANSIYWVCDCCLYISCFCARSPLSCLFPADVAAWTFLETGSRRSEEHLYSPFQSSQSQIGTRERHFLRLHVVGWAGAIAELCEVCCKCESFYGSPLRCTIEQIAKKWFLKSSQYTCVNELLVGQLTRVIREAGIELEAATFRTRRNHFESASTKQTLHSLVEFWRISFTQTGLFTATHILHCQLWRLSAPQISH